MCSKFLDSDELVFVLDFISKSTGIYTALLEYHLTQTGDLLICLLPYTEFVWGDVCCVVEVCGGVYHVQLVVQKFWIWKMLWKMCSFEGLVCSPNHINSSPNHSPPFTCFLPPSGSRSHVFFTVSLLLQVLQERLASQMTNGRTMSSLNRFILV